MRKTQTDITVYIMLIFRLEAKINLYSFGYLQKSIPWESLAASALIVLSKINLMKTNQPLQKKMHLSPTKRNRSQYSINMIIKLFNLCNARVTQLKISSIQFCKIMIGLPLFHLSPWLLIKLINNSLVNIVDTWESPHTLGYPMIRKKEAF